MIWAPTDVAQIISHSGITDDIRPVTGSAFNHLAPGEVVDLLGYDAELIANGLIAGVLVSDGDCVRKRELGEGEEWIEGYRGMYSTMCGDVYSWKRGQRKRLRPNSKGQVRLCREGVCIVRRSNDG